MEMNPGRTRSWTGEYEVVWSYIGAHLLECKVKIQSKSPLPSRSAAGLYPNPAGEEYFQVRKIILYPYRNLWYGESNIDITTQGKKEGKY